MGPEADSEWSRRPLGAARGWPAPPGRLGHRELLSGSTSAWNFSYFPKTDNTELLWNFYKVFLPYCIPICFLLLLVYDTVLRYVIRE